MSNKLLTQILGEPSEEELKIAENQIIEAKRHKPYRKPKTSKKDFMNKERQNKSLVDKKIHITGDHSIRNLDYLNNSQIRKHPSAQDHYEQKAKANKFQMNMLPHKKGIEQIVTTPEIIGIKEKIIGIAYPMQNQKINRFDVILESRDSRYIIKYSPKNHNKKRKLAKHQLIETKEAMNETYLEKPTKMIYVSGIGFESEILTKEGLKPLNYTPRE